MKPPEQHLEHQGCGCGCTRRDFLAASGVAAGGLLAPVSLHAARGAAGPKGNAKATVRAAFLYPPSALFSDNPEGWWSWPGNEFDAEGRQKQYMAELAKIETALDMRIAVEPGSLGTPQQAEAFAESLRAQRPDGVLLVMFYNNSLKLADQILDAAAKLDVPAVFYIGLGVKHGPITQYRRPGLYFIQSLDNFAAIEAGMRMISARKRMSQAVVLSLNNEEPREGVEPFWGVTVRVVPITRYAEAFRAVAMDARARDFIAGLKAGAKEVRGVSDKAFENAARAHFALLRLLEEEDAVGVTMNCLRRGQLKPCISFATLNGALIPAACENDLPGLYTQMLGQHLTGRPGFQHNPCYETEQNAYYGSHCTCATKLYGPGGPALPHLLRRFAHTNEGSCAIQVFWNPGDAVTMARYHPGEAPALDVYAGEVRASHAMPPAGGCTTNVVVKLTDRRDACMVKGHHNLLFCGDYAARFRQFANLYKMRLAQTGYEGPWPA